jgi:transposase-like protein
MADASCSSSAGCTEEYIQEISQRYCRQAQVALEDENKMRELIQELEIRGCSKAADTIEHSQFSLWNYRTFPISHQRRIRTTNGLERIKKQLKRRTRVLGAFPSDQLFMRLGAPIQKMI